jgi:hypothetical protein
VKLYCGDDVAGTTAYEYYSGGLNRNIRSRSYCNSDVCHRQCWCVVDIKNAARGLKDTNPRASRRPRLFDTLSSSVRRFCTTIPPAKGRVTSHRVFLGYRVAIFLAMDARIKRYQMRPQGMHLRSA